MKREKNASYRILAKGVRQSENSRETGLNNNMLVTGISGCGKTGSFVNPNINSAHNSIVVVDTKGLRVSCVLLLVITFIFCYNSLYLVITCYNFGNMIISTLIRLEAYTRTL